MEQNGDLPDVFLLYLTTDGSALYTSSINEVFRSTDNGVTWTWIGLPVTDVEIRSVTFSDNMLFVTTWGDGVFRSTSQGPWFQVNTGLTNLYIHAFALEDSIVFAGTISGLFLSTNFGDAWHQSNEGLASDYILDLAVGAGYVFVLTNGGIFRSSDNGAQWTDFNEGLPNGISYVSTLRDDVIAGGSFSGSFRSPVDTLRWTATNWEFWYDSYTPVGDTILAGAWNGVSGSTDEGTTWFTMTDGINGNFIYSMATLGNTCFAATGADVFRSTDGGRDWTLARNGLPHGGMYGIRDLVSADGLLFAGVQNTGVFISTDSGETWEQSQDIGLTNLEFQDMEFDGTNLFVGTRDGVSRTSDDGLSWTVVSSGNWTVNDIEADHGVLYVQHYYHGLEISTDAGDTWVSKLVDTRGDVQPWCIAVNRSDVLLGVSTGAQFSTDSGTDWTVISDDLRFRSAMYLNGKYVGGSYDGHVYLSSNNGKNWTVDSTGLPTAMIWSLAANDSNLYVGTYGNGIWYRSLSELDLLPEQEVEVPERFVLYQNYPNPFNPSTTISFETPRDGIIELKVFNLLGEEVATLVSGEMDAGTHSAQWDATGQPSGVYFYRLRAHQTDGGQAGEFVETRKLLLLR